MNGFYYGSPASRYMADVGWGYGEDIPKWVAILLLALAAIGGGFAIWIALTFFK
jgi:hypothetical protein